MLIASIIGIKMLLLNKYFQESPLTGPNIVISYLRSNIYSATCWIRPLFGDSDMMNPAYKVGEIVEVKQHYGYPQPVWLPALVVRLEPYLGQPGYYVHYTGATEQWDCHGGWTFEARMRRPAA